MISNNRYKIQKTYSGWVVPGRFTRLLAIDNMEMPTGL